MSWAVALGAYRRAPPFEQLWRLIPALALIIDGVIRVGACTYHANPTQRPCYPGSQGMLSTSMWNPFLKWSLFSSNCNINPPHTFQLHQKGQGGDGGTLKKPSRIFCWVFSWISQTHVPTALEKWKVFLVVTVMEHCYLSICACWNRMYVCACS